MNTSADTVKTDDETASNLEKILGRQPAYFNHKTKRRGEDTMTYIGKRYCAGESGLIDNLVPPKEETTKMHVPAETNVVIQHAKR